jgi:PAS domain S-box-containing protein
MKQEQPTSIITAELLFEHSPDLLCCINTEGIFTKVNNAMLQALGYTRQELEGMPICNFVDPQDWEATHQILINLSGNLTISDFKNRYHCLDGTHKWLSWNAVQIDDQTYFGSARDITLDEINRQRLIEMNRFNECRLTSLIESGNDIIVILNEQGIYQFVSPSVQTILHTNPAFYLGKVTFQFIHPEDLDWVTIEFGAVLETDKPLYIPPFRFQTATGEWVWIETIATNRISDPAINGIVINARDVTAKRKHEQQNLLITQELAFSNERYSLAIEATKDVIWDWDLQTDKLTWGKGLEKYFGKDSDSDQQKTDSWKAHFHPEDKKRVIKNYQADIANPEVKVWKEEYRLVKGYGEIVFISDHGYIIRDVNKKAIRIIGSMHDITELREKEQRLSMQNEQLIEIALINSHELRGPAATILGLIDLLDVSLITDTENKEVIKCLKNTALNLDKIIRHINARSSS